jgi:hypothetical protein
MIEYDPRQQAQLGPYYNYGMGGTQGGYMGNTGGLVGNMMNMAFQQPGQQLMDMGMDVMSPEETPATPATSMYFGPQMGQPDQYPAARAGFLNKRVS